MDIIQIGTVTPNSSQDKVFLYSGDLNTHMARETYARGKIQKGTIFFFFKKMDKIMNRKGNVTEAFHLPLHSLVLFHFPLHFPRKKTNSIFFIIIAT